MFRLWFYTFAGEPRDVADRAWHAGPGYRDIAKLFAEARERLRERLGV